MQPGDVRIRNGTAEHVLWLDAEACRWLMDLLPERDMFRQELLEAAEACETIDARAGD